MPNEDQKTQDQKTDNRVTIRIWFNSINSSDPSTWKNTGHVSLQTYRGGPDGKGIHASFFPAHPTDHDRKEICNESKDHFHDSRTDKAYYRVEPKPPHGMKVDLWTLDVEKINATYTRFVQSDYKWDLLGSSILSGSTKNCAGLVLHLLEAGGFFERLGYGKSEGTYYFPGLGLISGSIAGMGIAAAVGIGVAAGTAATVGTGPGIVFGVVLGSIFGIYLAFHIKYIYNTIYSPDGVKDLINILKRIEATNLWQKLNIDAVEDIINVEINRLNNAKILGCFPDSSAQEKAKQLKELLIIAKQSEKTHKAFKSNLDFLLYQDQDQKSLLSTLSQNRYCSFVSRPTASYLNVFTGINYKRWVDKKLCDKLKSIEDKITTSSKEDILKESQELIEWARNNSGMYSSKIFKICFFVYNQFRDRYQEILSKEFPEEHGHILDMFFGIVEKKFYKLHCLEWSDKMLYVCSDHIGGLKRGNDEKPGDQGHLLLTPSDDYEYFTLTTERWKKDYPLYVCGDAIGGLITRGTWNLDKQKLISLIPGDSHFILSSKQWPDWTLYVCNDAIKAVQSYNDLDPGPQGHFVFTPL